MAALMKRCAKQRKARKTRGIKYQDTGDNHRKIDAYCKFCLLDSSSPAGL